MALEGLLYPPFTVPRVPIKPKNQVKLAKLNILEDMARYVGLLLAPAKGFGRGFFLPFGKNEIFLCCLCYFIYIYIYIYIYTGEGKGRGHQLSVELGDPLLILVT